MEVCMSSCENLFPVVRRPYLPTEHCPCLNADAVQWTMMTAPRARRWIGKKMVVASIRVRTMEIAEPRWG